MRLRRIHDWLWEIPREGAMRVPGRVYADGMPAPDDPALGQVANVACLPGIVGAALAMPDMHWGYGFPIGGVAAMDPDAGAVSPGGVGYDVNCGVRLVATRVPVAEIRPRIHAALSRLFQDVPTGVGASAAIPRLSPKDLDAVLAKGARWAVGRGFAASSPSTASSATGSGRPSPPSTTTTATRSSGPWSTGRRTRGRT